MINMISTPLRSRFSSASAETILISYWALSTERMEPTSFSGDFSPCPEINPRTFLLVPSTNILFVRFAFDI